MAAASLPLTLLLPDNAVYKEMCMSSVHDPSSWKVTTLGGRQLVLSDRADAASFFQDLRRSHKVQLDQIFVSVTQDDDGRHLFVNMEDAAQSLEKPQRSSFRLPFIEEDAAKSARDDADAVLLYARAPPPAPEDARLAEVTEAAGMLDGVARRHTMPLPAPHAPDELCPHRSIWASNYSVVRDLSLGATQRLILCDEATLTRELPEERIFEHLNLIVNCHEHRVSKGKYKVGACTIGQMPDVICYAVHEWYSLGQAGMNKANDEIQAAMWEHLQEGTVAVHCLAGIHRAACIVACHYLWRHYVLGHQDIPCEAKEIYRRLKAVRPAVSPAYEHVLRNYEAHLQRLRSSRQ